MNREGVLYVLKKLNIEATLPKANNVQVCCPLAAFRKAHTKGFDSRPSMGISISEKDESVVNCFTCRWGSTLKGLVEELFRYERVDEKEADHLIAFISKKEEVDLEDLLAAVSEFDIREEIVQDKVYPESTLGEYANKTHRYLLKRGMDIETIKVWEGGFDSESRRVTFPVRNNYRNLVGLIGRAVSKEVKPTYMNYWKFSKGRFLFGEDKFGRDNTMIIVEGPLDVIMVWQALNNEGLLDHFSVGGLFGADATVNQIRKMVQFSSEVILFLDNDAVGRSGQKKIGRVLSKQTYVRGIDYEGEEKDPGEMVANGVRLEPLLNSAKLLA